MQIFLCIPPSKLYHHNQHFRKSILGQVLRVNLLFLSPLNFITACIPPSHVTSHKTRYTGIVAELAEGRLCD